MSDEVTVLPASAAEELAGILQQIRDKKTDGIAALRSLLDCFPNSPEIVGHLAYALAYGGDHAGSLELLRRHLTLLPGNMETRWRMGDRLIALGRLDEALEAYRDVLRDYPDCLDAEMGVRYVHHLQRTSRSGVERYVPEPKPPTGEQEENCALCRQEFDQQRLRLRSLPTNLHLESTTKCNFCCRTCTKGYGPYYAEDLHPDILEKVRREVMPTNLAITISGFGEPTMSLRFDEVFQMALANGSKISFITNGSLLNWRRIEWLTRYPVDVAISIDGATRETFESVRTGSNFERTLETFAMIKKLNDIYFPRTFGCSFLFVALQKNIHELPEVVRMAHRYNINRVAVADYAFTHTAFDEQSLRFDPQKANRYFQEAREVAEQLGVCLLLPPLYAETAPPPPSTSLWEKIKRSSRLFPQRKRFPRRCPSPWIEPYIRTDGKVRPCCASSYVLGDLKKNRFEEIWNGWRYRLLRWRIHSWLPPFDCRCCFVHWGINGGNAGNIMAKEGLLLKGYYFLALRAKGLRERLQNKLSRLVGRGKGPGEPAPNFDRGRPIPTK